MRLIHDTETRLIKSTGLWEIFKTTPTVKASKFTHFLQGVLSVLSSLSLAVTSS